MFRFGLRKAIVFRLSMCACLLWAMAACMGPHPLEGKLAPALETNTTAGLKWDLGAHKGKDVVLLDFWATWCPPCREALPKIASLARKFEGKSVAIFPINVGDPADEVAEFLKEQELSIPVGLDTGSDIATRFGVNSLPTTMLIDRNGVIVKVYLGYGSGMEKELEAEIDRLLGSS